MKTFLLIDDHPVVRNGIKVMIHQFYKTGIVDEAENESEAIAKIRLHHYDIIFLDINIPNTNTIELLKHILIIKPESRVLIFSMNTERIHAKRYLEAGAMGYLSKDASIDEMNKAIHLILHNKKFYSENLIESLFSQKGNLHYSNPFERLTEREFQIVIMFLGGKSLTEISALLHIQPSTTGTHKAKIFEKLDVKNMVELIELADLHKLSRKA